MGTGIYRSTTKIVNGERQHTRIELTSREIKAYIMKVEGLTSEQYKKKYDIFKNKLRAYEAFERHAGKKVTTQSPVQILYKIARSKYEAGKAGETYKPSIKLKRILSFQSVSSGKAGQKLLQREGYVEQRNALYEQETKSAFENFIEKNAKAREIYENVKDPVMREQALADYAKKLHAKVDAQGKVSEEAIREQGEVIGSDSDIDFDYSVYNK